MQAASEELACLGHGCSQQTGDSWVRDERWLVTHSGSRISSPGHWVPAGSHGPLGTKPPLLQVSGNRLDGRLHPCKVVLSEKDLGLGTPNPLQETVRLPSVFHRARHHLCPFTGLVCKRPGKDRPEALLAGRAEIQETPGRPLRAACRTGGLLKTGRVKAPSPGIDRFNSNPTWHVFFSS